MTKRTDRGKKPTGDKPKPKLAHAIKEAIERSGHTPHALAKRAGVPSSTIYRLLSGESGLSLAHAERLMLALGFVVLSPDPDNVLTDLGEGTNP